MPIKKRDLEGRKARREARRAKAREKDKMKQVAENKILDLLSEAREGIADPLPPEEVIKDIEEAREEFITEGRKRHYPRATREEMRARKGGRVELNPNQEAYCRLRVEGFDKTRAYIKAYGNTTTPGQSAWILEDKQYIKDRIRQLQEERAIAAKIVDPEESLARWNDIYQQAMLEGDRKSMIEAQKQIDKINGADKNILNIQTDNKSLFSLEDDWKKDAAKLLALVSTEQKLN